MNHNNDFETDMLKIKIFEDDIIMGQAAGKYVSEILKRSIKEKGEANIIIATGASQFTFYEALRTMQNIEWDKIIVFHLDEYVGMSDKHPASFRRYLQERILKYVNPKKVYFLNGDNENLDAEIKRYEALLETAEIDLACIGIGENGHIAFNDPPIANFNDPHLVKMVELDADCRRQQLGEGWFPTLNEVPTHALSLTVPAIMKANTISCVVPDARKSEAVYNTVNSKISEKCPATILRTHSDCTLFLDINSAQKL